MLVAWLFILFIWSAIGFAICLGEASNLPFGAEGFEFVNPIFVYKRCRVNVFGAIVMTIFTSLICPYGTIIYWIYKLCTIGRKEDSVEDY